MPPPINAIFRRICRLPVEFRRVGGVAGAAYVRGPAPTHTLRTAVHVRATESGVRLLNSDVKERDSHRWCVSPCCAISIWMVGLSGCQRGHTRLLKYAEDARRVLALCARGTERFRGHGFAVGIKLQGNQYTHDRMDWTSRGGTNCSVTFMAFQRHLLLFRVYFRSTRNKVEL